MPVRVFGHRGGPAILAFLFPSYIMSAKEGKVFIMRTGMCTMLGAGAILFKAKIPALKLLSYIILIPFKPEIKPILSVRGRLNLSLKIRKRAFPA